MKKPFPILLVIAAVWLVIIAVPRLRYLCSEQLQGNIWPISALASPHFSQIPYHDLAKKYPNDLAVLSQAAEEYYLPKEAEEYSDEVKDSLAPGGIPSNPALRDDPSPLFPGTPRKDHRLEVLRRYDLLLQKFPNNAWLIARRLRLGVEYSQMERVGGELSDAEFEEHQRAGVPSPEHSKAPPNYTPQELQKTIALAKRGVKLEPKNAFFNWMATYFLLLDWRDGEAWKQLDSAATKSEYDSHKAGDRSHTIAAQEKLLGRPLTWEEKSEVLYGSFQGEFPKYREMARIIGWQSIKAQRKGDHRQNLRILNGLLRVTGLMRDHSDGFIGMLVARAMQSMAWSNVGYDSRLSTGRKTSPKQRIGTFSQYATKYGYKNLVAFSDKNYAANQASVKMVQANSYSAMSDWFGVSAMLTLKLFGGIVLLLLPISLLGYVLLSAVKKVRWLRKFLHVSQREEPVQNRELWNGALACGGLRALGSAIGGALVCGLTFLIFANLAGQSDAIRKAIADWWTNTTTNTFGSATSIWQYLGYTLMSTNVPTSAQFTWTLGVLPLVLGALWCAWRVLDWQEYSHAKAAGQEAGLGTTAYIVEAFKSGSIQQDRPLDVARLVLDLARWVFFLLFLYSLLRFSLWQSSVEAGSSLLPLAFALLFFGVLLAEIAVRWKRRSHRRAAVVRTGRLFHGSLLRWLLLGSLLYGSTLLLALPFRARANTQLDRVIAVGETKAASGKF